MSYLSQASCVSSCPRLLAIVSGIVMCPSQLAGTVAFSNSATTLRATMEAKDFTGNAQIALGSLVWSLGLVDRMKRTRRFGNVSASGIPRDYLCGRRIQLIDIYFDCEPMMNGIAGVKSEIWLSCLPLTVVHMNGSVMPQFGAVGFVSPLCVQRSDRSPPPFQSFRHRYDGTIRVCS